VTLVRVLHRVAVFVVLPVLGYLIAATIVSRSFGTYGADRPATSSLGSRTYAVATSCERRGPVGIQGFGYWWSCQADVHWQGNDAMSERRTADFLTPADIGERVQVAGLRKNRSIQRDAVRPYQFWWLAVLPFVVVWSMLIARLAPARKRRGTRRGIGSGPPENRMPPASKDATVAP
jgi:hypothetical protein